MVGQAFQKKLNHYLLKSNDATLSTDPRAIYGCDRFSIHALKPDDETLFIFRPFMVEQSSQEVGALAQLGLMTKSHRTNCLYSWICFYCALYWIQVQLE